MMFFNRKLKKTEEELEKANLELIASKDELDTLLEEIKILKDSSIDKEESLNMISSKYAPIIDLDSEIINKNHEIDKLLKQRDLLNDNYQSAFKTYLELQNEISIYTDNLEIGAYGLYPRNFDFQTSEHYKVAIELNYSKQKTLIKEGRATKLHTEWTVNGSVVEGRKQTNHYKKLMLFAFNGECDALIAKVKWNNANKTKERIYKTFEAINKLGSTHTINLTNEFFELKLEELSLTYEYEEKKQQEKEEQRQIREQMREEEKAQRDFEKAKKKAEEEEVRFSKALALAKQELGVTSTENLYVLNDKIKILEQKLQESQDNKERAIAMAQLTKIGHIYVISNIGSFGEDVYKIGMTRRLDPNDRVRELGNASVPFRFDVHAIIHSEDAPQLERELHQKFHDRRLNRINFRREFFKVTLEEIQEFIVEHTNAEIEFTRLAEAREYRETLTVIEQLNQITNSFEDIKFPSSLFE